MVHLPSHPAMRGLSAIRTRSEPRSIRASTRLARTDLFPHIASTRVGMEGFARGACPVIARVPRVTANTVLYSRARCHRQYSTSSSQVIVPCTSASNSGKEQSRLGLWRPVPEGALVLGAVVGLGDLPGLVPWTQRDQPGVPSGTGRVGWPVGLAIGIW